MRLRKLAIAFLLIALLAFPILAAAKKSVRVRSYTRKDGTHVSAHTRSASGSGASSKTKPSKPAPAIKCVGCDRDSHGKIVRSEQAKDAFRKTHPCPSTGKSSGPCPGYQIDHRTPLARGGADSPANMQWLTTGQHKTKTAADMQYKTAR